MTRLVFNRHMPNICKISLIGVSSCIVVSDTDQLTAICIGAVSGHLESVSLRIEPLSVCIATVSDHFGSVSALYRIALVLYRTAQGLYRSGIVLIILYRSISHCIIAIA
jgi:hypothetical protein